MKDKRFRVSTTVTITYTHIVTAKNAKEAEMIAEDMGESSANDAQSGTPWRAKRIKEGE